MYKIIRIISSFFLIACLFVLLPQRILANSILFSDSFASSIPQILPAYNSNYKNIAGGNNGIVNNGKYSEPVGAADSYIYAGLGQLVNPCSSITGVPGNTGYFSVLLSQGTHDLFQGVAGYRIYSQNSRWGFAHHVLFHFTDKPDIDLGYLNIDLNISHKYSICSVDNHLTFSVDDTIYDQRDIASFEYYAGFEASDGAYITNFIIENTIPNQAPTANINGSYLVNEGSTIQLNGSGNDSDNDPLTYYWDLDNNGTFETSGQNSIFLGVNGPDTQYIVLKVCDNQNACDTDETDVTITNVAPTVGTVTLTPNPVEVNTGITATVSFADPGVLDLHTATANWGDGVNTNAPCSVDEPTKTVTCTHPGGGYAGANVYTVTITVADEASSETSADAYASVYNPTQGSVFSAGQKFSNPGTATPGTSGNVIFGLNYKYQGGMPSGQRQFSLDFNGEDIHFNATTVTSLVISGTRATLRGTGTLNGVGTYNFLVVGEDQGAIRIKITDPNNGNAVIYDSQPGDSDTAAPTTSVTGQVIVN